MVYYMEQKKLAKEGCLEITNESGMLVYTVKKNNHLFGSEQILLSTDQRDCGRIKRIMNAYGVLPHYEITVGGQSVRIRRKFSMNSDYVIEGENIEIFGDMSQHRMLIMNSQRKRVVMIDRVLNEMNRGKYEIAIDREFCTKEDTYYILIAIAIRNAIQAIKHVQK